MTVQIIKFGALLMSHPAGKEAFLLAESHLFNSLDESGEIILDFADVKVLTPSWAEVTPMVEMVGFEPTRELTHWFLRPTWLPVTTHLHI